jgi:pyrroloquinoline quinone biosynthesis protein B
VQLFVLGSAAGGGVPQWNCRCEVCALAWDGDVRVKRRTQASLAVSAGDRRWVIVNATPDIRQQILACPALQPRSAPRSSPIDSVVLTNAEVDHVGGLLTLRERQQFVLHGTDATLASIDASPVFSVLDRQLVQRCAMLPGRSEDIAGLAITAFDVAGKVPLYLETEEGHVGCAVCGLEIVQDDRRCVYIPNCAEVTEELLDRMEGADVLFFDGTTFTNDEMSAAGIAGKTAQRMGHVAMTGAAGSIAALRDINVGQRFFTHLNNTNRALIEGSREREVVEGAGWRLAEDGMEIIL